MTSYTLSPQQLQMATNPSGSYSPPTSSKQAFVGADRIVLTQAAGALHTERLLLIISNTDTAAHTVTFPAGDPVLGASGQIALSYSIPAGTTRVIGPLDSARVLAKDGSISFTAEAGHSGTFEAYRLPKAA